MYQKGPILCQMSPIFSHGRERALRSLEGVLRVAVDLSKEPHLVTNEPDFAPKHAMLYQKNPVFGQTSPTMRRRALF